MISHNDIKGVSGLNGTLRPLCIYLCGLVLAAIICASVWPGYLSFDSLVTLDQARNGIIWNSFPPMVVYIQWVCDKILPGAGLLFALQNGLFFLALADVLVVLNAPTFVACLCMIGIAACPAVLGPMTCVWKDVGVLALFTASFACILRSRQNEQRMPFWIAGSIFCLWLGSLYRFNALLSALPLIWLSLKQCEIKFGWRKALTGCLTITLTGVIAASVWLINSYRLPDLKPIVGYVAAPFLINDLLGISVHCKQNLIPPPYYAQHKSFTMTDLRNDYCPQHADRSLIPFVLGQKPLRIVDYPNDKLMRECMEAIAAHPIAYLCHRWKVFKAFMDIGVSEPFYVTHGAIDPNKFGIVFHANQLTPVVMSYLAAASRTIFGFPWFYHLLSLPLWIAVFKRKESARTDVAVLLASALLLDGPMFFLTRCADLRFHLWAIAAIVLAGIVYLNSLRKLREVPPANVEAARKQFEAQEAAAV